MEEKRFSKGHIYAMNWAKVMTKTVQKCGGNLINSRRQVGRCVTMITAGTRLLVMTTSWDTRP